MNLYSRETVEIIISLQLLMIHLEKAHNIQKINKYTKLSEI